MVMAQKSGVIWSEEHDYLAGGEQLSGRRSMVIRLGERSYIAGGARLSFKKI
jgi:hypothetical protein